MDFITGVNRLLRINLIIGGDDDDITTFADTQHAADIEMAQIAIQDEIASLAANRLLDYEKTSGSITLTAGTRTYALAADFVRFYGSRPSFYDSTNNTMIYEYRGGENMLKHDDYTYKTTQGNPWSWYWDSTTSKKVGFYSVPDTAWDSLSLSYDYEKSVTATVTSDTLPFHTTQEAQTFIQMAARRFKVMDETLQIDNLDNDPIYKDAKATLLNLMIPTNPQGHYGRKFF